MKFELNTIGFVRSCYKEKFATPRQPGLVTEAKGEIELIPPFNDPNTIEGLDGCSHIWLQFVFHQCIDQGWKAKVRPPRLGGNKKMGVFATRATHRPNSLGLSVVKLDRLECDQGKVILHVSGLDVIDGTPVIDIKPYIPYSDSVPDARYDFAGEAPSVIPVYFCEEVEQQLINQAQFKTLLVQVLSQDPKPAFHSFDDARIYGAHLNNSNVTWCYEKLNDELVITVQSITPVN